MLDDFLLIKFLMISTLLNTLHLCRIYKIRWNLHKFPQFPVKNIANSRTFQFFGIDQLISFLLRETKSNSIAYHFVRECVAMGEMTCAYIKSEFNQADIATKVLPHGELHKSLIRNMLYDICDYE